MSSYSGVRPNAISKGNQPSCPGSFCFEWPEKDSKLTDSPCFCVSCGLICNAWVWGETLRIFSRDACVQESEICNLERKDLKYARSGEKRLFYFLTVLENLYLCTCKRLHVNSYTLYWLCCRYKTIYNCLSLRRICPSIEIDYTSEIHHTRHPYRETTKKKSDNIKTPKTMTGKKPFNSIFHIKLYTRSNLEDIN